MSTELLTIIENPELLEIARIAVEDELVERRDSRISVMRNNGLTIREYDGEPSSIIRLRIDEAIKIGLKAISQHLEKFSSPRLDKR